MTSLQRVLSGLLLVAACSDSGGGTSTVTPPASTPDGGSETETCEEGATVVCDGEVAVSCDDGARVDCAEDGKVCVEDVGCATCEPYAEECVGDDRSRRCTAEGTWGEPETCEDGCDADRGTCAVSLCDQAEDSNSYIGCDYFAVTTANAQLDDAFSFAVVVANPQGVPAQVTVTQGANQVASATVQPGALSTIELPWVQTLKGEASMEASALVRSGAYHIVSSVPVTVYQFNPLEYEGTGCTSNPLGSPGCFSYTNDASLLIPTHVMTGNYIVAARASTEIEVTPLLLPLPQLVKTPGFFAVVGAEPTPVEVNITFRGSVTASVDGAVQALSAGQTGSWTLNQGDVLQILSNAPDACTKIPGATIDNGTSTLQICEVGDEHDLTGSIISANGKVGVFGGHSCAFVPETVMACDHLEEMLLPLETWGKDFIVSATEALRPGEPNYVRIVSGSDENQITFEPASVHAAATLGRGQMLEFEATQDFRVVGSGPLMIGQFLVGQNFTGNSLPAESVGDPSFSLAIPTEQYRSSYSFLAPTTYDRNYVNVVAEVGANVSLDGSAVSGFTELAGSGYQVARVAIQGGAHTMEGSLPFGIVVYGFGAYTSYMYPGGLDLEPINPQ